MSDLDDRVPGAFPFLPPLEPSRLSWDVQWGSDQDWEVELRALQGEAMGWQPLGSGVYVHASLEQAAQVCVVGVPDPALQGQCVVLLL